MHVFKVKEHLEMLANRGPRLIGKSDVFLIFGKIPAIYAVHSTIVTRLKETVDDWKGAAKVAQVRSISILTKV